MRARLLVLTLVLLAVIPAEASAATKRSCSVKGSETVVSNRYARVYTVPGRGDDEVTRLYGCSRSLGRRVLLDIHSDDQFVASEEFSDVGLNGRKIVWKHVSTDYSCKADCPVGYEPVVESVWVVDARTRKRRAVRGNPVAGTLLVTRTGTPAWLEQTGDATAVRAGVQVLDTGAIEGLALVGNVLSWRNAGESRTATLP